MKFGKFALIIAGIGFVGYFLYLAVAMSSTYPVLKTYRFNANLISFEKALDKKVDSSIGWSMNKTDSIAVDGEKCCWVSLHYIAGGEERVYTIKYCEGPENINNSCLEVGIVDGFNYATGDGGSRLTNKGIEPLIRTLDQGILGDLMPTCKMID